jgi:hypothetical protein
VRIAGTGFGPGVTVTIGGPATNVTVVSSTLITATAPTHPVGPVDVVVTSSGGEISRLPGAYTYVPVAVATVSPASGLSGDPVRITGTGFLPGATLTLGGVAATFTGVSSTVISARTPVNAAGVVDVVVTNPGGQSGTLSGGYTYGAVSLTASLSLVAPGAALSVSWTAPSGRTNGDWLALFKVGDPNEAYGWWAFTEGATAGTLTLTAPAQPGQYEFRYLINDDFIVAARSSPVTVGASSDLSRGALRLR